MKQKAYGIQIINDSNPSSAYITLKSFETLEKVADGQATKLIIPSSLQDVAGLVASVSEIAKDVKKDDKKKD